MSAVPEPAAMLRPMRIDDLDAVLAVENAAYSFPWTRGNFIDSMAAGYPMELLVTPDQRLLGYWVAMLGVDELHLLNLTVTPAQQGRGHGSAMLGLLAAFGRRQGLATLWLEVRASNLRARALYRRRGFSEVGLRRGYYPAAAAREDAVVMSAALNSAGPHGLG